MVLVGLWHGANWTFVVWGVYHGLLLIGYRLFDRATVGTAIDKVMKKRRISGARTLSRNRSRAVCLLPVLKRSDDAVSAEIGAST